MKKCLSVLFSILLIILMVTPVTCLADEPVWSISKDGKTVTYNQKVFTLYEKSPEIEFIPENEVYLYRFADQSEENLYKYEYVAQISEDVIYLINSGVVYVTEKGIVQFEEFIKGEYSYYLYHYHHSGVVDFEYSQFEKFMNQENITEIDVTTLWNDEIFYVRGFDETGCFAHKCGAVYFLDNEYYYIHYDALDISYFDAYGEFSYRKGTVPAYKLTGENESFVSNAKNAYKTRHSEYIYPDEEAFFSDEDDFKAFVTIIVISLIFGLIIPAVPLVLSIKFANSKKAVNPKRWYGLTVVAGIWIITFALMLLCLFI